MKSLKMISVIVLLLALASLNSCKKTTSPIAKSATIKLKAVTGLNLKSNQSYNVTSANISISNIKIEENSGNDGENVGSDTNNENERNDGADTNDNSGGETENGDIILTGPYTLDIISGSASIGQVNVYPGTFKKVDFNFQGSDALNGNSIIISGKYTFTDGTVTPFTINSAFSQMVQMPLSGNGVTVVENSSVIIDIVFDTNAWLNGINFESATVTNKQIIIDNNNNTKLLSTFEANLSIYVEQEE